MTAALAPSATTRLLLRAVSAPPPVAVEAWRSWCARVDLEHLEPGATELLSLVHHHLGERAAAADPRVGGVHSHTWARNRLEWAAARPLIDHLADAGVPPVVLGRAAVLPAVAEDWGARPLLPVELGLPRHAAGAGREALAATGWDVAWVGPSRQARTAAGQVDRWIVVRDGHRLVVRWHLVSGLTSDRADEQISGASRAAVVASCRVRRLHPADALVTRAWEASDHEGWSWVADVARLADHLVAGDPGGPNLVARRARAFGIDRSVRRRLALAASCVPDHVSTTTVLAALEGARPTSRSRLWDMPRPVARLGRAWAGRAAGTGLAAGGTDLVRSRVRVRQVDR